MEQRSAHAERVLCFCGICTFEQSKEEIRILASYDSFVKISYVYSGEFAFVWTADNKMGVVDYKGDLIVPAVYQKIEYDYPRDDRSVNTLVFLAYDENEVVHVINGQALH